MAASFESWQPVFVSEAEHESQQPTVQLVLGNAGATAHGIDRRRERRFPFPYPIRLQPVEMNGVTPAGDEIGVLGKHLTERGLDFYHREPLPCRRGLVTFDCASAGPVTLLIELTWCRFGQHGWYENGGRFVK
jgi:hypothetical protein